MTETEFKLQMEFCGFDTHKKHTKKFYRKYLNGCRKKIESN